MFPRIPLRRAARILNGGTPPSGVAEFWDGAMPFVTPPDLNGLDGAPLESTARTITADGVAHSGLAPAGSVLLSTRAPIGHVGRLTSPAAFNQGCRALVPTPNHEARFLAYALVAARADMDARGLGTTFLELSGSSLAQVEVPLAPPEEQRAIADYLDRETAQIDAFIAKNEELITLLTERGEAQLKRLVLEPRDAHRVPLKAALRKLRRKMPDDAPVVTAFRDGQVTDRSNRRLDGFTETETEARSGYQGVRVGDVVYHGLDGFAGAVGVCESDGICSPVYHVCESTPRADAHFIALLLQALGKAGYLEASAWSVRQRSVDYRNWATFSRLLVDLPPIDVQREIVGEALAVATRVKMGTSIARRSVELARERRAALISAAVTGKINVGELT